MVGRDPKGYEPDRLATIVILVVGAVVQLGGTLGGRFGGLPGILDLPVVALLMTAMGCAMVVSALAPVVAAKRQAAVVLILAGGEQTRITPRLNPTRALAVLGLLVSLGAFGWQALWAVPRIGGPMTGPVVNYDVYPRRYLNTSLVGPTVNGRLSRFTTYTGQILDADRLDYGQRFTTAASLTRRERFYGPTTLDYQTFALEFELQARPDHAPVTVEAIRVIVDSYERLPRYAVPVGTGPINSPEPFYMYQAVLARPPSGTNLKVLARLVATEDTPPGGACARLCLRPPEGGAVLVTDGQPTPFLVKIEAPLPGFYGFDVEVLLSSGLELQRVEVASFTQGLFY